jgi:ABC-type branched-subunit amino acid transport system ATPase component
MSDLLLKNLEIRSFRGFRHLKIERLGRVNLIVGKNNVGKTALLEALRLYASRGSPNVIWEIVGGVDESRRFRHQTTSEKLALLKYIFYGRKDVRIKSEHESIQIGPMNAPEERLSVGVGWDIVTISDSYPSGRRTVGFSVQLGTKPAALYPLDESLLPELFEQQGQGISAFFVSSGGLTKDRAARLWDRIALTSLQEKVLDGLRLIAPGITGINFVADNTSPLVRLPIVKVVDMDEPLPLGNLGDGMNRMLGIALALVNARDGMLLIDEIENGLHYSIQPDMWRIIFQLARQLNVQVFATSHSWDCIEAFQQAAQEDTRTEGLLIRLEYKKGEVVPTLFDERELGIVTREQIEVR